MEYTYILVILTGFLIWKIIKRLGHGAGHEDRSTSLGHGQNTRPLSFMENVVVDMGDSMNMYSVLLVRTRRKLTVRDIEQCLTVLPERHPLLGKCIRKDETSGERYFNEIDNFKPDLKVNDSSDWITAIEDEMLSNYDIEKGPLFKCVYLPNACYDDGDEDGHLHYKHQGALVMGCHHAIGDGISLYHVVSDIVDNLDAILKERPLENVNKFKLLPPLDFYLDNLLKKTLIGRAVRYFFCILDLPLFADFFAQKLIRTPSYCKMFKLEEEKNPNVEQGTCLIPVCLTREQTSKLLAACKRHKTSVHGAVTTAASTAYARLIHGQDMEHDVDICIRSPVDARVLFNDAIPSDYAGTYAFSLQFENKISLERSFWEHARKARDNFYGYFRSIKFLMYIAFITSFPNTIKRIINLEGKSLVGRRNADILMSNLGKANYLNRDDKSDVKMAAIFGGISSHTMGDIFSNYLVTFNGKLFWSFIYYKNVTSKETAQKFAEDTIKILLKALEE